MTERGSLVEERGQGMRRDGAAESVSGLVFILSGPSGVGKSTLIDILKQDGFPITYCVTATTRAQRPGEVDGVHYYFLGESEFQDLIQRDQLLEHAVVHTRYHYGIPLSSVREGLKCGHDLIMTPEVQGAATVRQRLPNAVTIFLQPSSIGELMARLEVRGTESAEDRLIRLQTAEREMARVSEYDYVVVSRQDRQREMVEDVKAIITAERLKLRPRVVTL